jgi:hypothetical protein
MLPKEPTDCEGASMRLYQMFDLSILMLYPEDYMGRLLPQICGKSAQKSSGFYPTPLALCQFISKLVSGDKTERISSFNAGGVTTPPKSQTGQRFDSPVLKKDRSS